MQTVSSNKRLAINTIMLYIRMLIIMVINLYISRLILSKLGVEDFGIYNVVAGFITMFTLISNALSTGITRYITYEIGTGNMDNLKRIFTSSVTIQVIIGFCIFILIELFGVWFLNHKMVIPEHRLFAANCVLQLSTLTLWINLIGIPYNATIIAHEHMNAYAFITILEALLKLAACFIIGHLLIDSLILYAILLTVIAIIIRLIYGIYCKNNFEECSAKLGFDKYTIKQLASFSGWNMIGASSAILRDYGVNILLNLFFGTLVNAARGIAMQVSSAVQSFSSSFITAINPQITKSFASNEREESFRLVFWGAKITFFLLFVIALPFLFEANFILSLWLGEYPPYTEIFVKLIIIYVLSESISYTMVTLMLATGDIKWYQIVVGGCQMLNFPISYVLLLKGFNPESTFYVSIFVALLCLVLRLIMLKKMVDFPIKRFLNDVLFTMIRVATPAVFISYFVRFPSTCFINSLINIIICVFISCVVIFGLGFNRNEKKQIISLVLNTIRKK